ncbi:MAG: hypothetical protein WBJ37_10695 [Bacteroidales bacterium]
MIHNLHNENNYEANRYFNYLLLSIIFVFIAGIVTYGEKFRFWEYAYSYIGMYRTPGGNPNTTSFLIFIAGSLFNSFICFKIKSLFEKKLYQFLFAICGTGFILLTLPCDILNPIHSTGGAMVFGSLWIFSHLGIYDIYHSGKSQKALVYFVLLNITVLPYAYLYFFNSPHQLIAQKPAIIGLVFTVKMVISEHADKHVGENLKREVAQ